MKNAQLLRRKSLKPLFCGVEVPIEKVQKTSNNLELVSREIKKCLFTYIFHLVLLFCVAKRVRFLARTRNARLATAMLIFCCHKCHTGNKDCWAKSAESAENDSVENVYFSVLQSKFGA